MGKIISDMHPELRTPFTVHRSPFTDNRPPRSVIRNPLSVACNPTPNTDNRIPITVPRTPRFQISDFGFRIFDFGFNSAFRIRNSACPDFGFRIGDFELENYFRIPYSKLRTPFTLIELLARQAVLSRRSFFAKAEVPSVSAGRRQVRKAFTLIELLVVIAIIAILMAILLPALSRVKQLVRMTVCASNQHQTGVAIMAYAADYNNNFPSSEAPGSTLKENGDIDDSTAAGNYNRYLRLGSMGTLWIEQMDGVKGYDNAAYTCPAGLPADNDKTGDLPKDGVTWIWASRRGPHAVENWSTTIPNEKRGWFSYLAPLNDGVWYDNNNLGWGWNNALSSAPPISGPGSTTPNNRNNKKLQVIAFCPIQEPSLTSSDGWPTIFRAPHMNRPIGPPWAISTNMDARNYLFNDGHVQRLVK